MHFHIEQPIRHDEERLDLSELIDCSLPLRNADFTGRRRITEDLHSYIAERSERRESACIVIVSGMGEGKTSLLTEMIHRANDRRQTPVYHFISSYGSSTAKPENIAACIYARIASKYQLHGATHGSSKSFGDRVERSLAQVSDKIVNGSLPPEIIYIDGADHLAPGTLLLPEVLSGPLPPAIFFVISSRPKTGWLPARAPADVWLMQNHVDDRKDIEEYLQGFNSRLSSPLSPDFMTRIAREPGGPKPIFFTVRARLRQLEDPDCPDNWKAALRSKSDEWLLAPQELIAQESAGMIHEAKELLIPELQVWRTLAFHALAEKPFDEMHLRELGLWDESSTPRILALAANFFEQRPQTREPHRPYVFAHRSYRNEIVSHLSTFDFRWCHRRLADGCLRALRNRNNVARRYAFRFGANHLAECERWRDLIALLNDPKLDLIRRWVEGGEGEQGLRCLRGLIRYFERQRFRSVTAARFANYTARIYSLQGSYDNAQHELDYAMQRTSWLVGRRERAVALHEYGSLELYRGRYREAERAYLKAMRLCRWSPLPFYDEIAANLNGIATVRIAECRYTAALGTAKQALREATIIGDIRHIISAHRLTAIAQKAMLNFQEAHNSLGQAFAKVGDLRIEYAPLRLVLGWLRYEEATLQGHDPLRARSTFEAALREAELVGNRRATIEARFALAWCALIGGDGRTALTLLEQCKDECSAVYDHGVTSGILVARAAAIQCNGDRVKAKSLYCEAIEYCRHRDEDAWRVDALVGLGACQICSEERGECELGEATLVKAQALAKRCSPLKRSLTDISIRICRSDPRGTPR